jgi:hypothetical protein
MKFINRIDELSFLQDKISSPNPELLILYGRRRIGKTELIQHFLENNHQGFYFLSRLESQIDSLRRFNNSLGIFFNDNSLVINQLQNWDSIFNFLANHSRKTTLIVIDEIQYLIERNPDILSIIQDYWDNKFHSTKIKLIFLGSSISLMEKHTLDYNSPIYGRRTGQWKVEKFHPEYLLIFFPTYSTSEIIETYGSIDTIPGYLQLFDPNRSLWQNIESKILSKGEFLYEEPLILLREELRDPSNYMSILSGIAGGLNSFNELYQKVALDKSILSKYLFTLEQLGLVEKFFSLDDSFKKKLKGKGEYKIKDNFLDFWFRFVFLNQQLLEQNRKKEVLDLVRRDYSSFMGYKFEQFILELLRSKKLLEYNQIGRWWQKDIEIDIVALNSTLNNSFFIECKWQENVDALQIFSQLEKKATSFNWNFGKRNNYYMIFAKSFKSNNKLNSEPDYMCYNLEDIQKVLTTK